MSTAVQITLIICGTLIVLSAISTLGNTIRRKKAEKAIKNFLKEKRNNGKLQH